MVKESKLPYLSARAAPKCEVTGKKRASKSMYRIIFLSVIAMCKEVCRVASFIDEIVVEARRVLGVDIRGSPFETEMKARTRTAINVSTEIVRIETVGGRDENTELTSQILLIRVLASIVHRLLVS